MSFTIALVGNPNCGKTTLFNALTGSHQRVGNWPGVTVDRKSGYFTQDETTIEVVDIPGTYSLVAFSESKALDEHIACEFILSGHADLIVNVLDAANLERNLYLTQQLLDMDVPMVIALNMMDVARQHSTHIDVQALSRALTCPVVALEANKSKGVDELETAIIKACHANDISMRTSLHYPAFIEKALERLQTRIDKTHSRLIALRLLEGDICARTQVDAEMLTQVEEEQREIIDAHHEEADIVIADTRYDAIHALCQQVVTKATQARKHLTTRLDKLFLNRLLGIPIFLAVIYLMFLFSINVAGVFQDFFDLTSQALFVDGVAYVLHQWGVSNWLIAIIASGIGKGINTVVTFIPIIGGLFLFLSFLESSGYMARAAFIMDRFMRAIGLPGKAFVPLIIGFGCNVPAIMAARTLDNQRDRILTILMTPFTSCGARLAIYAVFTAAFFPTGAQNIVFALYIIGIMMAVMTGLILRKTLLTGEPTPFIMELPPYHLPTWGGLRRQTWMRLKRFIMKAGRVILPACALIGILNALTIHGALSVNDAHQYSLLSFIGRKLTPLFSPMGLHADNWPATVGLLTGVLAKEVVIATLNTLYTQVGHLALIHQVNFNLWGDLQTAVATIPANLIALPHALGSPLLASVPQQDVNPGIYGLMHQRFVSQAAAFSYLLFVLLYMPCLSAVAVMMRELNKAWSFFFIAWSTGLAYTVAVIFYQIATWSQHPVSSSLWIGGLISAFLSVILGLHFIAQRRYLNIYVLKEGHAS